MKMQKKENKYGIGTVLEINSWSPDPQKKEPLFCRVLTDI